MAVFLLRWEHFIVYQVPMRADHLHIHGGRTRLAVRTPPRRLGLLSELHANTRVMIGFNHTHIT